MTFPLIAVDIGNARMKLGVFEKKGTGSERSEVPRGDPVPFFPEPLRILSLDGEAPQLDTLISWLGELTTGRISWFIASVNRPGASRLINWLRENRSDDSVTMLSAEDLPLTVHLERPDMVGIDRLVDAVAVNRLRQPGRPAVIVDVGTAITVDLVSADGAFLGGSILPGLEMSAHALHECTDLLPLIDVAEFSDPPPALGTSTAAAMRSGLFWGAVGAIRQLIDQLTTDLIKQPVNVPLLASGEQCIEHQYPTARPQVFLTGGAGATVAQLLAPDAQYVPHLTLAGIALAVARD
jgi:type III pantothenate kinase